MYLFVVYAMVAVSVVLFTVGLLGAYAQRRKRTLEAIVDGADETDMLQSSGVVDDAQDGPDEQEVLPMPFWDPLSREMLVAKKEIIPLTVLRPDGKELQIGIAVRPETAAVYLSSNGGPKAFKDAIIAMRDDPGWCLAATSGGALELTMLSALYDVIVGQMVDGGDVDGWLETLQAYWEYDVGFCVSDDDDVTEKIDMRMTHEELDVTPAK